MQTACQHPISPAPALHCTSPPARLTAPRPSPRRQPGFPTPHLRGPLWARAAADLLRQLLQGQLARARLPPRQPHPQSPLRVELARDAAVEGPTRRLLLARAPARPHPQEEPQLPHISRQRQPQSCIPSRDRIRAYPNRWELWRSNRASARTTSSRFAAQRPG